MNIDYARLVDYSVSSNNRETGSKNKKDKASHG
jgi:hypothetical protein